MLVVLNLGRNSQLSIPWQIAAAQNQLQIPVSDELRLEFSPIKTRSVF